MKRFIAFLSCSVFLFLYICPVNAYVVDVTSILLDGQDNNEVWGTVHELGNQPPFPTGEWIISGWEESQYRPCPENEDSTLIANVAVSITNMTNTFWRNLQYVADPETTLQNYDEYRVNSQLAFLIDNVGVNTPLISESMKPDLVFEPGETWVFVIQDYQNSFGLAPSLFASLGVPTAGDQVSSGSIIAIPEPASLLILGLGSVIVLKCKR